MIKSGVTVKIDKLPEMQKATELLAKRRVLVGIPAEKASRDDGAGINNATIGYLQENGAPEANIPARPHLVPGVQSNEENTVSRFKDAATAAMNGHPDGVDNNLTAAGLEAADAVRNFIDEGDFEPLKAATLANRRRHGRNGTAPLKDTHEYFRKITFVLRDKK